MYIWLVMGELRPSTELMKYLPQLSIAERDRRWKAIREKMAKKGLGCLLLWGNDAATYGFSNFRYLTHCAGHHGAAYAVFPLERNPVVFMGPLPMNTPYNAYLSAQNWVSDIRPAPQMRVLTNILKEMGYEHAHIGLVGFGSAFVPQSYTHWDYMQLIEGLPNARISDQTTLVEEMRLIKSDEEIGMLEKAGQLARKSIDAMIMSAGVGVRECEVWTEMMRAQTLNGGEAHMFILLSSDSVADQPGIQKRLLHAPTPPITPTTRPLGKGDLMITEFHSCYGGYLAAAEFSVFIGDPPRELLELHKVAVECLEGALEKFRPGVPLREVLEAERRPVIQAEYDYVELGFHGHGLSSPEFPTIVTKPDEGAGLVSTASGAGLGSFELRPGMVFGINIDIYNPKWRSDIGFQLGDMIVVTEKGPRRLVQTPTELACIS
jgi:Xaa-Pro aminopeptidase